jgi:hypothetical protein
MRHEWAEMRLAWSEIAAFPENALCAVVKLGQNLQGNKTLGKKH